MAKSNFYIYKVEGGFVKVGSQLKLGIAKRIDEAAYWNDKKQALSWKSSIKYKFPTALLKEAKLVLKTSK